MATGAPITAGTATVRRCLAVRRLELGDFRNHPRLLLEAGPHPVVLWGPNGAGKTNILEALSLLVPGRGLRGASLAEMDREGAPGGFLVRARLDAADGPHEVEVRHRRGEGREIVLDGRRLRGSAGLADLGGAVWLTPAMDRLFVEAPAARRRFLDRLTLVVDPAHAGRVAAFERLARERLAVLRGPRPDPAWLAALERRMAELAVAILAARRQALEGLRRELARPVMGFPALELRVEGELERRVEGRSALEAEELCRQALAALRRRDAEHGTTALGPHRSDLRVTALDCGEDAARASSGRQKAMLCAILLAQIRLRRAWHGDLPLVLLDEPATHLDAGRRARLFGAIAELGCQAWLTGTDREIFAPLEKRALFLRVDGARVERT